MNAKVFLYESFAAEPFGGNMAGVVLLESQASADWMQGVASDLAAPTTGFVDLTTARSGEAQVRFFTPGQEIDACGHVSVAIATALIEEDIWHTNNGETHTIAAPGGRFPLALTRESGAQGVQVTMRQQLLQFAVQDHVQLDELLGEAEADSALPVVLASTGLRHLLVPVQTPRDLAVLPVDVDAILRLSREYRVDTIGVYSVPAADESGRLAVRIRDLCAGIGAAEEPASGTTSGALALALHQLGWAGSQTRFEITMGVEMGRPSRLSVTLDATGPIPEALLSGSARRVLKGTIELGSGLA